VLYPVLKDVPYVNRILPDAAQDGIEVDTQYRYDSLDAAVDRIKELEVELADASAVNAENEEKIAQLEEQIADLSTYKEAQAAFELEKEKFYEEVVFSDEAPDIEEYKAYYESIDPENAEVLYKQVVEQIAHDEELDDYVATFSSMKPKEAATIFNTMTDDLGLVADILMQMDTQSRADILGKMDSDTAAKVAEIMEPSR
jgi:flagellar motility protein MotE (MotC chaperone)